jgi:hypothetical protein
LSFKSFAAAILLDDHVRDFVYAFVARETPVAFQALTPPTNRVPFLALARIDDLILQVAAERAFHYSNPLLLS